MTEVAYFDIYPKGDAVEFVGTWSNYPYFPSGNIIVSSIENGLFVLRPTMTDAPTPAPVPTPPPSPVVRTMSPTQTYKEGR